MAVDTSYGTQVQPPVWKPAVCLDNRCRFLIGNEAKLKRVAMTGKTHIVRVPIPHRPCLHLHVQGPGKSADYDSSSKRITVCCGIVNIPSCALHRYPQTYIWHKSHLLHGNQGMPMELQNGVPQHEGKVLKPSEWQSRQLKLQ